MLYCESCRESCHPKRGPLAAHNLGPAQARWQTTLRNSRNSTPHDLNAACYEHQDETVSLYCALCKVAACGLCLRDRHTAHPDDVIPSAAACKALKVSVPRRGKSKSL